MVCKTYANIMLFAMFRRPLFAILFHNLPLVETPRGRLFSNVAIPYLSGTDKIRTRNVAALGIRDVQTILYNLVYSCFFQLMGKHA